MADKLTIETALENYQAVPLDTCVLINEFNNRGGILRAIKRAQRRTSLIALWEFLHGPSGVSLAHAIKRQRDRWLDDQGVVAVGISPNGNATFRVLMRGQGPPGAVDCLLAAESLARKWPLVTSNVKDFDAVVGLRIVPV